MVEDHWSETHDSNKFLGLSVRYLHGSKIYNRFLNLKMVKGTSAEQTNNDTFEVVKSFGLDEKVLKFVTDNCPSMVKAFDNEDWYGCFIHVLSLV